ncbi:hypothetical protein M0R01_02795 [bacterium]|nr:hypothetical protein [bacterium]
MLLMVVNQFIVSAIKKKFDNNSEIRECCQKGFSSFEEMVDKVSLNLNLTKETATVFLEDIGYNDDVFPKNSPENELSFF